MGDTGNKVSYCNHCALFLIGCENKTSNFYCSFEHLYLRKCGVWHCNLDFTPLWSGEFLLASAGARGCTNHCAYDSENI